MPARVLPVKLSTLVSVKASGSFLTVTVDLPVRFMSASACGAYPAGTSSRRVYFPLGRYMIFALPAASVRMAVLPLLSGR